MIRRFDIEGPVLFRNRVFTDDRGFFCERFKVAEFAAQGLPTEFPQENYSRSRRGVLRGLHYQWDPPQGKLVTCARGRIFDVAVDIRQGSPTYGRWAGVELSGDEPAWFWIPAGFAHGFSVLSEDADVMYKVDALWNGAAEGALKWDDPDLGIDWPGGPFHLSAKDDKAGSFRDYQAKPRF